MDTIRRFSRNGIAVILITLMVMASLVGCPTTTGIMSAGSDFGGSIILGRPTTTTMTAQVVPEKDSMVYLTWGEKASSLTKKSAAVTATAMKPATLVMTGLSADKTWYYQLHFKANGESAYRTTRVEPFQMPKTKGRTFNFTVQSDSHLKNKADRELYEQGLEKMASLEPDFMLDLGDTFLHDQDKDLTAITYETVRKTTAEQLPYMGIVAKNAPLFLAIGNHEGEYGYFLEDSNANMADYSTKARTTYFPNPVPNAFYSGNTAKESGIGAPQNYYAYTWGDALFVVIDPYRYTIQDPYNMKDGWGWTLGKTQYDWFNKTLENSNAKYKFVFAHHAIGNVRGGAEVVKLYEWGGYDKNGKYLFDEMRPGWGKPIHQVMKDAGVTIFFQGHDHLFARETVDGIVYQTLPKPAERVADAQNNFVSYPKADRLLNSGFLNVTVGAEGVKVDYHRGYMVSSAPQKGNTGIVYSYTVDSKHQVKVLKATKDDLSLYGGGSQGVKPQDKSKNKPQGSEMRKQKDGKTPPVNSSGMADTSAEVLNEPGDIYGFMLGAPTEDTISAKALLRSPGTAHVTYAPLSGGPSSTTDLTTLKASDVYSVRLQGLEPDTAYAYKLMFKGDGKAETVATSGTFRTARSSGSPFTFTVQADSHRDENSDMDIYKNTLTNIAKDEPDLHFDLGDTFMAEKFLKTEEGTLGRYLADRSYFALIAKNIPLFLVNGNHEGETGWSNGMDSNIKSWAVANRLKYFINPSNDGFYSGSESGEGNYYAFEWGDAQFIILDPFWFTKEKARTDTDGWSYTLGKTQYDWLVTTLDGSNATHRFVFIHNLVGGIGKDARGGAEAAEFYEWGGQSADGTYAFDKMRPGWGKPIHDLLVEHDVDVVFHGHDHFYAKQEADGIIYQLVPQPSHPGGDVRNVSEYGYVTGDFLPASGYMRVAVPAKGQAGGEVLVEYVQTTKNGGDMVAASYLVK